MKDQPNIVVLAAGKGTRMQSDLPKVLHELNGKPMLEYVLDAVERFTDEPIVVVGYREELVRSALGGRAQYSLQTEQLGTGHAVMCAAHLLEQGGARQTIVLYGDMPLITDITLERLREQHEDSGATLTVLTATPPHFGRPYGALEKYGRIVRDEQGSVRSIVEYKDATEGERAFREVNTGVYCFSTEWLLRALPQLNTNNGAGEYYLTDLVALARDEGLRVEACQLEDVTEALGANTPDELAMLATLQIESSIA